MSNFYKYSNLQYHNIMYNVHTLSTILYTHNFLSFFILRSIFKLIHSVFLFKKKKKSVLPSRDIFMQKMVVANNDSVRNTVHEPQYSQSGRPGKIKFRPSSAGHTILPLHLCTQNNYRPRARRASPVYSSRGHSPQSYIRMPTRSSQQYFISEFRTFFPILIYRIY